MAFSIQNNGRPPMRHRRLAAAALVFVVLPMLIVPSVTSQAPIWDCIPGHHICGIQVMGQCGKDFPVTVPVAYEDPCSTVDQIAATSVGCIVERKGTQADGSIHGFAWSTTTTDYVNWICPVVDSTPRAVIFTSPDVTSTAAQIFKLRGAWSGVSVTPSEENVGNWKVFIARA